MINAKDLPEMEIFDELIAVADNSLVKQAMASGRIPVGYNCYSAPVPLMTGRQSFHFVCERPASRTPALAITTCPASRAATHAQILRRLRAECTSFLRAYVSGGACVQMIRVAQHSDV